LWDSKLLIASITVAAVVLGGVLYVLQPRVYESKVSVFPLRQTQFVGYLGLSQENSGKAEDGAFPYTPATLFTEFSSYLTDTDKLMALAAETGIVERGTLNDEEYGQAVARFVSAIRFETPNAQDDGASQTFLNIKVQAGDRNKLLTFVKQALTRANADMANDLSAEVQKRADEIKDQLDAQTAQLQIEIDARRQRIQSDRTDDMVRLAEQSMVARSLGIEKPLDLRAIEAVEKGSNAPAQINSNGNQPQYLQGYAALDERIKTLQDRKDDDPFISDLRQLQQQLYLVKNDPRPARILGLLKRSPLADPATAMLARFSIASARAEKVSPRLIFFGAGSLILGLLIGSAAALVRQRKSARA